MCIVLFSVHSFSYVTSSVLFFSFRFILLPFFISFAVILFKSCCGKSIAVICEVKNNNNNNNALTDDNDDFKSIGRIKVTYNCIQHKEHWRLHQISQWGSFFPLNKGTLSVFCRHTNPLSSRQKTSILNVFSDLYFISQRILHAIP